MSLVAEHNPFTGRIGEEYGYLDMMCPNVVTLKRRLGEYVRDWNNGAPLRGLEIGCGTGLSTLSLLLHREDLRLLAFDSSPAMLKQARENLASCAERVDFIEGDALAVLKLQPDASADVIASNYTIHNFLGDYREQVFAEVLRVLKPGGLFANGDRFAIDDRAAHLVWTQGEVRHWFKSFMEIKRLDLLEDWIAHLLSDESPHHIMVLAPTLATMQRLGFANVHVEYREGVDALVTATKI
jgi:tRNA (cmo5U34)-methyltransferase